VFDSSNWRDSNSCLKKVSIRMGKPARVQFSSFANLFFLSIGPHIFFFTSEVTAQTRLPSENVTKICKIHNEAFVIILATLYSGSPMHFTSFISSSNSSADYRVLCNVALPDLRHGALEARCRCSDVEVWIRTRWV